MIKKTERYVLIFLSLCSPAFNAQSGFSLIEDDMDKSRHYDQAEMNSSVAYDTKAYKFEQALKDHYRLSKAAPGLYYSGYAAQKELLLSMYGMPLEQQEKSSGIFPVWRGNPGQPDNIFISGIGLNAS